MSSTNSTRVHISIEEHCRGNARLVIDRNFDGSPLVRAWPDGLAGPSIAMPPAMMDELVELYLAKRAEAVGAGLTGELPSAHLPRTKAGA